MSMKPEELAPMIDHTLLKPDAAECFSVNTSRGVRNYEETIAMIVAKATRLDVSADVKIIQEQFSKGDF